MTAEPFDELEVQRAIEAALAESLTDSLAVKWLAVVEVATPDGDRALWSFTSDGLKSWESVGLLRTGQLLEEATYIGDES